MIGRPNFKWIYPYPSNVIERELWWDNVKCLFTLAVLAGVVAGFIVTLVS
jgi:hypothetical protein